MNQLPESSEKEVERGRGREERRGREGRERGREREEGEGRESGRGREGEERNEGWRKGEREKGREIKKLARDTGREGEATPTRNDWLTWAMMDSIERGRLR